ncbi:hypothetical protein BBJ28_00009613 [Nothophytophthora sp. Chile5]|nr:hypothetical protein BBJ28_00009613 [Nothophytophthora sp. Chile5]
MSSAATSSGNPAVSADLAAATPIKTASSMTKTTASAPSFASLSFLSPEPVTTSGKTQNAKHTLSGAPTRKVKPQKQFLDRDLGPATPTTSVKPHMKKAKKLKLTPAQLPPNRGQHSDMKKSKKQHRTEVARAAKVLEDISNRRQSDKRPEQHKFSASASSHAPTRKLEFLPTPVKEQPLKHSSSSVEKAKPNVVSMPQQPEAADNCGSSSSSSSSSSGSSSDDSDSYSSDECEVTFDAATIGNMRVVREAQAQSPALSSASSSSSSMAPVGLEFQFAVSSTVSSVAVAPNGKFLVVGFYNGMVYLYPLTQDSLTFRRGVLLDQILPRGMYTQIMVRVAIPEDGKFIFAGIYRGSTEIRAFEVDSITFPSSSDQQQLSSKVAASSLLATGDSDDSMDEDEDTAGAFGLPTAKAISYTYSDPKLKGFAAAKSLYRAKTKKTEYRLLCGIGIKNIHMWRFYQKPGAEGAAPEWSWECVFDKQTNGISLEFITFHRSIADQFISKSEHQNVRIWHLEEEHDDATDSVIIRKKSHTDVKQTTDTIAVYGDYAYGGGESLAVVDLRTASRMDLDLPLSVKEQRAQLEAAKNSRAANSLRAWNPRGSRRRGAEDTSGMRHMRTVSQVAGQDLSPFTVGMCSDGSVFFHRPRKETGIATPLDYIEGYENFFVDPSLDFQAQFSDLTRVNTSGLLAVLPLPETEKERWMVVAANQDQLLVRSQDAFLHRNQQKTQYSQVKSDLRSVVRDLGGAESSAGSGSENNSDSGVEGANAAVQEQQPTKKNDKASRKRVRQEGVLDSQHAGRNSKVKKSRQASEKAPFVPVKPFVEERVPGEKKKGLASRLSNAENKNAAVKSKPNNDKGDRVKTSATGNAGDTAAVMTPKRGSSAAVRSGNGSTVNTASPVVSISSISSSSSNPNTPEQPGLSRTERQLLALKELQWTPPSTVPNAATSGLAETTVNAAIVLAKLSASSNAAVEVKSSGVQPGSHSSGKKANHRMKAQALFTGGESPEAKASKESSKALPEKGGQQNKEDTANTDNGVEGKSIQKQSCSSSKKKAKRIEPEAATSDGKDMAKPAKDANQVEAEVSEEDDEEASEEDEEELELEQLEQYEPVFLSVPLVSDKGSLLAAALYQYVDPTSAKSTAASADYSSMVNDDMEADHAEAVSEQANLLLQFAEQNERLKMNFQVERERINKHLDCSCASHSYTKKTASSKASSGSGINWKRGVAHEFLKRKQLKRRQKKQLAAKLQGLHASYAAQIEELFAMQQLEANAFLARQQFQHLYRQLGRHADKSSMRTSTTDSISGAAADGASSPSAPTPPIKHWVMPNHLSDARFPHSDMLSS